MKVLLITMMFIIPLPLYAELSMTPVSAEQQVRQSVCKNNLTIEQVLQKKIKKRSQRDLGWRVFTENNKYDVERAILINKSMQIRYRWQIDQSGSVTALSKRAKKLCKD